MGDQQQKQGGQDRNQNQRDQQAQQGGQERHQGGGNIDRDKGQMGNKPGTGSKSGQSADRGMVGQDTDDDGKTVQPGKKPGLSHGTGHIDK